MGCEEAWEDVYKRLTSDTTSGEIHGPFGTTPFRLGNTRRSRLLPPLLVLDLLVTVFHFKVGALDLPVPRPQPLPPQGGSVLPVTLLDSGLPSYPILSERSVSLVVHGSETQSPWTMNPPCLSS